MPQVKVLSYLSCCLYNCSFVHTVLTAATQQRQLHGSCCANVSSQSAGTCPDCQHLTSLRPCNAALSQNIGKEPVGVEMLSEKIVLFRNKEDKVVAINDVCPHRGAPLHKGENRLLPASQLLSLMRAASWPFATRAPTTKPTGSQGCVIVMLVHICSHQQCLALTIGCPVAACRQVSRLQSRS